MPTEPSHIASLLLSFHRETLSDADRKELDAWVAASEENARLYRELTDPDQVEAGLRQIDRYDADGVRQRILARMPDAFSAPPAPEIPQEIRLPDWRRLIIRSSVAAALIALLGTGAWWLMESRQPNLPIAQTVKPADIAAPARSRATLTLGGGQQVDLDSAASGELAMQGGAQIVKGTGGQLAYQLKLEHSDELLYNTLSNPRGSQVVTLTLSDGTKVWLNAESSVRYPAVFVGNDRSVEMTGEAYFEVAKDAARPFRVKKGNATIEVLGTSFNVHAYEEEAMKVTLLAGKVRVAAAGRGLVLAPGQQAVVAEGIGMGKDVDTAAVMAWKNGLFSFRHADLPMVMKELARWYDVQVIYEGKLPEERFTGRMGRDLSLSQVFKLLRGMGVRYRIEAGNKLIIEP